MLSLRLVCPFCESQENYTLASSSDSYDLACPKCNREFQTRIVTIRAKRSRASKQRGRRAFSVRVITPHGREELIEFENTGTQDFEIRNKDYVAFTYTKNNLRLVQNFTIATYYKVSKPTCYIATHIYGIDGKNTNVLRKFRDEVLLESNTLSLVVKIYYAISPAIIRTLGTNEAFNYLARKMLDFIVVRLDK